MIDLLHELHDWSPLDRLTLVAVTFLVLGVLITRSVFIYADPDLAAEVVWRETKDPQGTDAWGNPYEMAPPGSLGKRNYRLFSSGPNGVAEAGAGDDVLVYDTKWGSLSRPDPVWYLLFIRHRVLLLIIAALLVLCYLPARWAPPTETMKEQIKTVVLLTLPVSTFGFLGAGFVWMVLPEATVAALGKRMLVPPTVAMFGSVVPLAFLFVLGVQLFHRQAPDGG